MSAHDAIAELLGHMINEIWLVTLQIRPTDEAS